MMDGFGTVTWWGFSPNLDLNNSDDNVAFGAKSTEPLNVLLFGAGDCRHILKTMARSYKYPKKKIHFYVLESNLELYARDILLLTLALENQRRMGLQEKTEIFLELFSNSLVRVQAIEYVEKMANEFIKFVTDFDYLEKKLPLFDLTQLKFKERDFLEGIFKFWRNKETRKFNIVEHWDMRVRQHLGPRYDAIPNVFDWEYSMRLCEKNAGIIRNKDYQKWRHKGIAYEIREGTYETTNKTLINGVLLKHEGDRIPRRGYWGDILVSPYITFGIESDKKDFFKKGNNQFIYSSQHVAEHNLLQLFHELTTRTEYVPPEEDQTGETKEQPKLTEITEEDEEAEEIETASEPVPEDANPLDLPYEPLDFGDVKITFLPLNCSQELWKKSKYQKLFNYVYISNSLVHNFTEDLTKTFADTASVVLETAKFMLELKDEQCTEFVNKITAIAKGLGCKPHGGEATLEDSIATFVFNRSNVTTDS